MSYLVIAALAFAGIHLLIAGTRLRDALVARLGDNGYRAAFSVLSAAALAALIWAYAEVRVPTPAALVKWPALLLNTVALLLVIYGVTVPGPTAVGGERLLDREARGMHRITRHPMLWGFVVWAATHMAFNPQPVNLFFFGTFLVVALAGTFSIDAKRARLYGQAWHLYTAQTSNLPFAAIAARRNRLVLTELGWWRPLLALLIAGGVAHGHARLFGLPAL